MSFTAATPGGTMKIIAIFAGLTLASQFAFAENKFGLVDFFRILHGRWMPTSCELKTVTLTTNESDFNLLKIELHQKSTDDTHLNLPVQFALKDISFNFEEHFYEPSFSRKTIPVNETGAAYWVTEVTTYDMDSDNPQPSTGYQGPYVSRKTARVISDVTTGNVISMELTKAFKPTASGPWIPPQWTDVASITCD
jgi:hypothetical protein